MLKKDATFFHIDTKHEYLIKTSVDVLFFFLKYSQIQYEEYLLANRLVFLILKHNDKCALINTYYFMSNRTVKSIIFRVFSQFYKQ